MLEEQFRGFKLNVFVEANALRLWAVLLGRSVPPRCPSSKPVRLGIVLLADEPNLRDAKVAKQLSISSSRVSFVIFRSAHLEQDEG
jgi:hypothetical protein